MNLQSHGDVQDLHIPMIDFSMSAYFIQRILGGYYTYYLYFSLLLSDKTSIYCNILSQSC